MGMFAGRSVQQTKVTHTRLRAWGQGKLRIGISARLYCGLGATKEAKLRLRVLSPTKGVLLV
jgi:hypothetical protein